MDAAHGAKVALQISASKQNRNYTVVFVVQVIADMGILLSSCGSLVSQCLQNKLFIYKYSIGNPLHPAHGSNTPASARSTTQ